MTATFNRTTIINYELRILFNRILVKIQTQSNKIYLLYNDLQLLLFMMKLL